MAHRESTIDREGYDEGLTLLAQSIAVIIRLLDGCPSEPESELVRARASGIITRSRSTKTSEPTFESDRMRMSVASPSLSISSLERNWPSCSIDIRGRMRSRCGGPDVPGGKSHRGDAPVNRPCLSKDERPAGGIDSPPSTIDGFTPTLVSGRPTQGRARVIAILSSHSKNGGSYRISAAQFAGGC